MAKTTKYQNSSAKGISKFERLLKFLSNPWVIMSGMIAGIFIGLSSPKLSHIIQPIGEIYVSFFKMCVIPIIITIIITSVADIVKSKTTLKYFKKFALYLISGMVFASILGIATAYITEPGRHLSTKAEIGLGKIITQHRLGEQALIIPEKIIYLKTPRRVEKTGLLDFLERIVPANIFQALVKDERLQILFFSLLFGIALGLILNNFSHNLLEGIKTIYTVFDKMIHWALYLLSIGLLGLFAGQIAKFGVNTILILIKYILTIYCSIFLILIIDSLIIWRNSKVSYLKSIAALKEALLITFGSGNTLVGIPSALKGLQNKIGVKKTVSNLIFPISINIFQFTTIMVLSLNAIFFMQLFNISINFGDIMIIFIGAITTSITTLGLSSFIIMSSSSVILFAVGVPPLPAFAIGGAVTPIVFPLLSLGDFYTNCALISLFAKKA